MLEEYALVPDVFDPAAYSNAAYADMRLPDLLARLLDFAVVCDLREGGWSRFCKENVSGKHSSTKYLLKALKNSNRLRSCPASILAPPTTIEDWCREALDNDMAHSLAGVIAASQTKKVFAEDKRVGSIEKLHKIAWWRDVKTTRTVPRTIEGHLSVLRPILEMARSFMFIDPNLDPSRLNYREFVSLLAPLEHRSPKPKIEIHRSFCDGDGKARRFPELDEWCDRFKGLGNRLKDLKLRADVYLWADFHKRYLITDVLGINVDAGFDTTGDRTATNDWTRIGPRDRDDIQREFTPCAREPEDLKWTFEIGAV